MCSDAGTAWAVWGNEIIRCDRTFVSVTRSFLVAHTCLSSVLSRYEEAVQGGTSSCGYAGHVGQDLSVCWDNKRHAYSVKWRLSMMCVDIRSSKLQTCCVCYQDWYSSTLDISFESERVFQGCDLWAAIQGTLVPSRCRWWYELLVHSNLASE